MYFPRYWAKAEHSATSDRGKRVSLACWRWSDVSVEAAQAEAMTVAQSLVQRVLTTGKPPHAWAHGSGYGYGYSDRPLRELVLRYLEGPGDQPTGAITRNSYGCDVLNTTQALFVDVDFSNAPRSSFWNVLLNVIRLSKRDPERAILDAASRFVDRLPGWGLRAYRTAAGVRLLATHGPIDIASDETMLVFLALGADPLYRRLCMAQQSYRARLTPKYWRCNVDKPPASWPFQSAEAAAAFEAWHAKYQQASEAYATCRLVATLGEPAIHPALQSVVELHDAATRADSKLPLA